MISRLRFQLGDRLCYTLLVGALLLSSLYLLSSISTDGSDQALVAANTKTSSADAVSVQPLCVTSSGPHAEAAGVRLAPENRFSSEAFASIPSNARYLHPIGTDSATGAPVYEPFPATGPSPTGDRSNHASARPSKTILVTGGSGFIGRNLCRRLLNEGHRVIALDCFCSSIPLTLQPLLDEFPERFQFILHDITFPIKIVGDIDQIYNLACPASPPIYEFHPLHTLATCFQGVSNMLAVADDHGARILQASTSEVYGQPQVHPQPESYFGFVNPFGERSCYDEGKRVAETLLREHYHRYGTEIRIVRIFNTYGPGMHPFDGRVVSNFLRQAIEGKPLTIYGEGTHTRSFQYIDDLVEGIVRLMNTDPKPHNPLYSEENLIHPVNIGNPDEITILQLAEAVIKLTKSEVPIQKLPPTSDDPDRRRPDISYAKQLLNWEPKVSLHEGLSKTLAYFRSLDFADFTDFVSEFKQKKIKEEEFARSPHHARLTNSKF
mmetsp:Transcript_10307/g.25909  ORF Transcript_10307/g.25909 Transcript_10307/m.25909 type:complete len:493 (-) Transcript_10307:102-1580(-)|eukprot:CAMPEP_0177649946 /NCGR_PEP_ID=MMETSP0447-20121125/11668_1 /TAXON_ID=0 /ORGANISM="Stygamoeba regulata, Strain BSH-02190019" /LENGTH=492 /DNA_ID=CAMNT_0019152759 /DNA_START=94 /DNA_END=1572 /DNA_ORIENTATION=+